MCASIRRRATAALLAWGLAFSLVGACPCAVAAADACGGRVGHSAATPSCCAKTSSQPELRAAPCCDSGAGNGVGTVTASTVAPGPESPSVLAVVPGAALPLAARFPGAPHRSLPPRPHASPVLRI